MSVSASVSVFVFHVHVCSHRLALHAALHVSLVFVQQCMLGGIALHHMSVQECVFSGIAVCMFLSCLCSSVCLVACLFVVSKFACAHMPAFEFVYAHLCLFHCIKGAAAGHAK